MSSLQKRIPYRNKKWTKAARDQECTLNSPICNYDSSTVVFCHLNESYAGKGMSQKADDFAGFDGCSACHDLYDGRVQYSGDGWHNFISEFLLKAVIKTIRNRLDEGVIK